MENEELDMEMVGDDFEVVPDADDEMELANAENDHASPQVYLPGMELKEGEELVCDLKSYLMIHAASTGLPCLSFDIIPDELGDGRENFPLTAYIVCGTQATSASKDPKALYAPHLNKLIVMKMHNLHKTLETDDDESDVELDDDDDEPQTKEPQMTSALIKQSDDILRVRAHRFENTVFSAVWSERNHCVSIWDLTKQLQAVEDPQLMREYEREPTPKPVFTFSGHQEAGFAIDWNTQASGMLATGDNRRDIHIWYPGDSSWRVDQHPLIGHTASVEDLQWSPNERSVLASCSADKSMRIWDVRASPRTACMLVNEEAHTSDVNVISWNRHDPFIVSGGDDGFLHIWDLRQFKDKTPIATFKHHTAYISTVEWNPRERSVFASGGDDDQIAIWDLSLEKDLDQEAVAPSTNGENEERIKNLPPQLLFMHLGQNHIKELHWHPQMPGVILSTAQNKFNIFRTISV